jgi:hypothetical protein
MVKDEATGLLGLRDLLIAAGDQEETSYFLAQKCVFKEKLAPRGSMELIRQDAKRPTGRTGGP